MTPDQTMDLNVMGRAIGEGLQTFGKNHAEPPPIFEAKKYENVKLWLISCEDFFNRNPRQWVKQKHMILYAISRTKGEKMAHFTSWYRLSMTGEEGYKKEAGLLYWERFRQEIISRYANTAEEREALQAMEALKYEGHTATFLLAMRNLNIKVQLSGVTWRVKIEKKMPLEILKRLSMEKYDLDSEWIKSLESVGTLYENYQRDRALDERREPSQKDSLKRKSADDDRKFDKKKRKVYTKAEKEAYKASKQSLKGKRVEGKKRPSEYDQMHKGIPDNLIAERRKNGGCTRCGLTNHQWKTCRKEAQVTVVWRGQGTPWKRKEPNANQQKIGRPPTTLASQEGRRVSAIERPTLVWDDLSDRENTLARRN